MDINTLFKNNMLTNTYNKTTQNNDKQEKINYNKQKNQINMVFMDIDVTKDMCQGVYFSKSNIALKCNKLAKFCKSKKYMVCEKHKSQVFGS